MLDLGNLLEGTIGVLAIIGLITVASLTIKAIHWTYFDNE